LLRLDTKKTGALGRHGHWVMSRNPARVGYHALHVAIDDHSRAGSG
jgi:hypothetical protein